ncbi:MAG: cytochrome c [Gemmatimonadota bacterium]
MLAPRCRLLSVLLLALAVAPVAGQSALSTVSVERTERMLENRLACLGCHVIGDEGGRIGPILNGLSDRLDEARLRAILEDAGTAIPGTVMPHQRMAPADRARLAAYLLEMGAQEVDAGAAEAPPALPPGAEEDGAALYARHCAACHGDSGGGDGWNAMYLPVQPTVHADSAAMALRADDTLFDAIYAGGFVLDKSPRMPAFGDLFESAQIRALVDHIRTLCRCAQPPWAGGPS